MHRKIELNPCKGIWLLIDGAGTQVHVGLSQDGKWIAQDSASHEALVSIFSSLDKCLKISGITFDDIDGYLFGAGPGSTLGVRVAAMAIRSWQAFENEPKPILEYTALNAYSALLDDDAILVIAPWKTNWFNGLELQGNQRIITQFSLEDLNNIGLNKNIHLIRCGRMPKKIPDCWVVNEYHLFKQVPNLLELNIFHAVKEPIPFQIENPSYKKWIPQRHRNA